MNIPKNKHPSLIKTYIFIIVFFISLGQLCGQTGNMKDSSIWEYIQAHKNLAIQEMIRVGIPPTIKLAQGIVETDAGTSDLVKKSNNNFGLKCKKDWKGDTVKHDDDEAQECFRKYPSDSHSYVDQSDFLKKSPRYKNLFTTNPLDYEAWANELKNAGYATNPKYVKMLVKIIEDFGLQKTTLEALHLLGKINSVEYKILNEGVTFKKQDIVNNLIASKLSRDSVLLASATNPLEINTSIFNSQPDLQNSQQNSNNKLDSIDYLAALIQTAKTNQRYNDSILNSKIIESEYKIVSRRSHQDTNLNASKNEESILNLDMFNPEPVLSFVKISVNRLQAIYAVKGTSILNIAVKHNLPFQELLNYNNLSIYSNLLLKDQIVYLEPKKKIGSTEFHIVQKGETLYDISQKEGIELYSLKQFNFIPNNAEPKENQKIYLMYLAPERPEIYTKE